MYQCRGISYDVSGPPGSYSGKGILITPDEDKIVWNSGRSDGKSHSTLAAFIGVNPLVILPVKLVSFTGYLASSQSASLQWKVAGQRGIKEYVLAAGNYFTKTKGQTQRLVVVK